MPLLMSGALHDQTYETGTVCCCPGRCAGMGMCLGVNFHPSNMTVAAGMPAWFTTVHS
jgi:hypothetical protein